MTILAGVLIGMWLTCIVVVASFIVAEERRWRADRQKPENYTLISDEEIRRHWRMDEAFDEVAAVAEAEAIIKEKA